MLVARAHHKGKFPAATLVSAFEPSRRPFIMACCYIAALCIGTLVKACHFLDLDDKIEYNDDSSRSKALWDPPKLGEATPSTQPHPSSSSATVLSLSGLTCAACVVTVENAFMGLPFVQDARVSLSLQQATVVAKKGTSLEVRTLLDAVEQAGYSAVVGPRSPRELIAVLESKKEVANLKTALSNVFRCAVLIRIIDYTMSRTTGRWWAPLILRDLLQWCTLGVAISCQYYFVADLHLDGWKAFGRRDPNMNTLFSFATCLGLFFSLVELMMLKSGIPELYHNATAGLTLVIIAGRCLDALSRRQASKDLVNVYKPLMEVEQVKLSPSGQVKSAPSLAF